MKHNCFKSICISLTALLLCLSFSACKQTAATQSFPEPISGSELEALRAKYPSANAAADNPFLSIRSIDDLSGFNDDYFAAFAAVTITGAYTTVNTTGAPAEGMAEVTTTTYYVPAHIDSVLCQNNRFGGQGDVLLRIRGALDGQNLDKYAVGTKLVTLLCAPSAEQDARPEEYFSATATSFYLTDNNVLLSMSQQNAGIDKYSGWNLEAFRQELSQVFS